MSVRDLKGTGRWWALAGCLLWLAFTFFPLYWVAITSFKIAARRWLAGPTYIPFVDFEPTLPAWSDISAGQRGQFYNTFIASTIVGLSAALLATAIGSMAAYALVRFTVPRSSCCPASSSSSSPSAAICSATMCSGSASAQSLIYAFLVALALAFVIDRLPAARARSSAMRTSSSGSSASACSRRSSPPSRCS